MMRSLLISLPFLSMLLVFCEPRPRTEEVAEEENIVRDAPVEIGGIKLYPAFEPVMFRNASLDLVTPEDNAVIEGQEVSFRYQVDNFQLGQPTDRRACPQCADSEHGQHIHMILNNLPYLARYQSEFTETLEPGHYVMLSFLSRSYHESVKEENAYTLTQFTVGGAQPKTISLDKPFLFYSRPKDEYIGDETQQILLDFYLVNVDLLGSGNRVRATINGNEFILIRWQPYIIEGLPMGEATIKLELLDADGNLIDTPFNPSERTITLKQEAAS